MRSRKPDETRQDRRQGRALVLAEDIGTGGSVDEFPPRRTWLWATKAAWIDLWAADVATAYARHHVPAIYRLFELRDAQTRAWRLYEAAPMVDGSMGQPVASPAMAVVTALEKSIVALEDRLGLTPKAQANLGIAIGQHRLTAADVNRLTEHTPSAVVVDDWDDTEPSTEGVLE